MMLDDFYVILIVDSLLAPQTANMCSNGIIGIENKNVCCPLECGTCGGRGCSSRARSAGLTAEDCCTSRIHDSGLYCSTEGVAPCIIDGKHWRGWRYHACYSLDFFASTRSSLHRRSKGNVDISALFPNLSNIVVSIIMICSFRKV